ncbi:relaxase/mobilization nuclease domain-containing protein [Dyadobacter psychrotolerans]|uniref:MobA/VirD2-like nuclease domain-containing protein n=1 Tax=Dyadobacter psychrotolerans TaxID=2541721 RepID=A0A4R5D3U5_9BACT|nr:relaxase/mobilization nuclease domain-containing protein [Dyadobacter psychrotolerans]TDE08052.1 hypothetical protein E0F88_33240 [Dyadobacter psychrotolerans]
MVIKGRSRGNGVQLADYLLNNIENDRAQLLDVVRGTSRPYDLKKSLLEMSLSSELTKGVHGLYHAQINPAIGEDQPMSPEDWQRAADILEQHLGFDGQKRAIVLHEKKGRVHAHIVWERYDHETGILKNDGQNYKKHDQARAEIERELGHEITPQRRDQTKEPDHKQELTKLWNHAKDGHSFVKEAEKSGYQIAYSDDRRPWRVVTPDGQSLDLVRQLDNAKTKDVRDRLQPIRDELKPEAEALAMVRERAVQKEKAPERPEPEKSERLIPDKSRELSDSQDLAIAMLEQKEKDREANEYKKNQWKDLSPDEYLKYKQDKETQLYKKNQWRDLASEASSSKLEEEPKPENNHFQRYSYNFKIEQQIDPPPVLANVSLQKNEPDNSRELSDSQDLAAAIIERRKQQVERERKVQEAKQQSDITDKVEQLLEEARRRREQQQHDRNKGLDFDR